MKLTEQQLVDMVRTEVKGVLNEEQNAGIDQMEGILKRYFRATIESFQPQGGAAEPLSDAQVHYLTNVVAHKVMGDMVSGDWPPR